MAAFIVFWFAYLSTPIALWLAARAIGVWLYRAPPHNTLASLCGQCGYETHNLPSNICPECGSDLGVVGRWSCGDLTRRRYFQRLLPIGWAIVFLLAGVVFAASGLESFVPARHIRAVHSPYTALRDGRPTDWPLSIVLDVQVDQDASDAPLTGWYPTVARWSRMSSSAAINPQAGQSVIIADSDAGLTWDAAASRWAYRTDGNLIESGDGIPTIDVLKRRAADVFRRRPPPTSFDDRDIARVASNGAGLLATIDGRTDTAWATQLREMNVPGSLPIIFSIQQHTFSDARVPMWWPVAIVSTGWLVLLLSGWLAMTLRKRVLISERQEFS